MCVELAPGIYMMLSTLEIFFRDKGLIEIDFTKYQRKKFSHKSLNYPEDIREIAPQVFEETKADWSIMLSHQVRDLVEIDVYMERFNQVVHG